MSEEKLKTVSYYLQDNFPEAGESAYEQGDTTETIYSKSDW